MIGLYDSGVGGLSVWKELFALMPEEGYLYFGDTAHCPYGNKPLRYIEERAEKITRFLMEKGAEMVVVACNTATAAAIDFLRGRFSIPFVGMEPAVKPAAIVSRSGVIGVLATANTFKGSLYKNTLLHYASGINVIEKAGIGLVEAVEEGRVPLELLEKYIGEMIGGGADVIVLGCTHFPFLQREIETIVDGRASVINPAPAVALQAQRVASTITLTGSASSGRFFTTGPSEVLKRIVKSIIPTVEDDAFEVVPYV